MASLCCLYLDNITQRANKKVFADFCQSVLLSRLSIEPPIVTISTIVLSVEESIRHSSLSRRRLEETTAQEPVDWVGWDWRMLLGR